MPDYISFVLCKAKNHGAKIIQADHPPKLPPTSDRAKLLLEITDTIVSTLDLRNLVESIKDCLRQLVSHDYAVLYLYEPETNYLVAHALPENRSIDRFEKGLRLQIEGSPSGLAFKTRRMVITNLEDLDIYSTEVIKIVHSAGIKSACSLPLVSRTGTLGVLTLMSYTDHNFDEVSAELLEQVAAQIAIALDNALIYQKCKHQSERFEMLLDVSNALSAVLDLGEVLRMSSGILRKHIPHLFAGIALYDETANNLRIMALENPPPDFLEGALSLPIEDTPDGLAFTSRQIVLRKNIDFAEFPSPHMRLAFDAGVRSFCCVPLISRNEPIGVLAVAGERENSLTAEDGETIQLIANQLAGAIETAVQFNEIEKLKNQLTSEKLYLEEEIQSEYNFAEIVGRSAALKNVLRQIEVVAPTDSCVLLYGETGTGKELISRAIHNLSGRRNRTLVKLNCSAIPTGLLESELFGHEKGAFTGAVTSRIGRFELAHKGTLLLDEIGDIPLELQPKLLRVLQESEFERLGNSRTIKSDVRLIAATNCNLPEMVEAKTFRSDLYYRLNVFPVTIPPLRKRREDIPLLAGYFAKKHALRMGKKIESIPRDSIDVLCEYNFPGNVRELENFIERAVILTFGKELQLPLSELNIKSRSRINNASSPASLEDVEKNHIAEVLKQTSGKIAGKDGAADILGLPVSTLRHRMKKLGLK